MLRMHALLISINLVFASNALAMDINNNLFYFFDGQDIDYWREGKAVHNQPVVVVTPTPVATIADKATTFSGSTIVRETDAKPFSWDNYKNVRSPEFWDDGGDWIPPRPFREVAANPTQQNVNEYLEWLVRKTNTVNRFQEALVSMGTKPKPEKQEVLQKENPFAWNSLRIAYFYQSSCTHCQTSAPVVEKAKRLGAQVTFVQLDAKKNPPLHAKSVAYDASWAKTFPISSTPTWVLKVGKATDTLTGSLSLEELSLKTIQLSQQRMENK